MRRRDCGSLRTDGNVYKTIEDAQAYVDKLKAIQRVKEYVAENCEVVEDVEGVDTLKWGIAYNIEAKEFFETFWFTSHYDSTLPSTIKTAKDANKVLDNCEADLKVIWGIK